ncbi:DnaD domain-containing protein [Streptococcus suis]|nr:DnaD domain-containing protein [Streptococcus suis]
MNYSQQFRQGHLVLPSAILFHYRELFPTAEDFLVWQFFFYQNTSNLETLIPSEISQATGIPEARINQSIGNLQEAGLLEFKTISISGEIEVIFDALPALEKLDELLKAEEKQEDRPINDLKTLVTDFERELGRLLSPFEIEDLQKTIEDDKVSVDLVRAALKEAVFNNKTNWKYIQAILRNWRREGITTVAQVEAKNAEREAQVPKNVTVSNDFLDAMNLWKD